MALSDETKKLASKIKDALVVDAKSGTTSEKDKGGVYEATLPENITIDVVNTINNHNSQFVAAATLASGELAIETMESESDLERVISTVEMSGGNKINVITDRQKTYKDHLQGGDDIVKKGCTNVNYCVKAGKNSGQLKAARAFINELASDALA